MKNLLSFRPVQAFEPAFARATAGRLLVLLLAIFTLKAGAQERATRQATDAEVTAQADVKAYINPKQFAGGGGGGGPTNGLTQTQVAAMFTVGTNNYNGTNIHAVTETVGSMIITNSITNLSLTASTDLEASANKVVVSLPNGLGMKTNNGSGVVGWSQLIPLTWIAGFSNLVATVSGGANITVTPSQNASGGTNFSVALTDPSSLGQLNVGTAWLTNSVSPTNTMGGTAIDFSKQEATTNIAGNVTLTSVANLTAGAYNRKLIHIINGSGSDRTITLATGWGVGLNDTFVSTNGTRMNLWAECQPGVFTNVFQKQIVTH